MRINEDISVTGLFIYSSSLQYFPKYVANLDFIFKDNDSLLIPTGVCTTYYIASCDCSAAIDLTYIYIYCMLLFCCICLVPLDPPEKLQQTCPTCPILLPVDSPQAVNAAHITLRSYKRQSALGVGLGVKKITRAAAQVWLNMGFLHFYCRTGQKQLWGWTHYSTMCQFLC